MLTAIVALLEQPEPEREAWRSFFEHFVFGAGAKEVSGHLPEKWRNITGPK
jgi:hypothetical protein